MTCDLVFRMYFLLFKNFLKSCINSANCCMVHFPVRIYLLFSIRSPKADGHIPLLRKDSSLSNDVFESLDNDDVTTQLAKTHPETVPEETSSQLETPSDVDDDKMSLASVVAEKIVSVIILSSVHTAHVHAGVYSHT